MNYMKSYYYNGGIVPQMAFRLIKFSTRKTSKYYNINMNFNFKVIR